MRTRSSALARLFGVSPVGSSTCVPSMPSCFAFSFIAAMKALWPPGYCCDSADASRFSEDIKARCSMSSRDSVVPTAMREDVCLSRSTSLSDTDSISFMSGLASSATIAVSNLVIEANGTAALAFFSSSVCWLSASYTTACAEYSLGGGASGASAAWAAAQATSATTLIRIFIWFLVYSMVIVQKHVLLRVSESSIDEEPIRPPHKKTRAERGSGRWPNAAIDSRTDSSGSSLKISGQDHCRAGIAKLRGAVLAGHLLVAHATGKCGDESRIAVAAGAVAILCGLDRAHFQRVIQFISQFAFFPSGFISMGQLGVLLFLAKIGCKIRMKQFLSPQSMPSFNCAAVLILY